MRRLSIAILVVLSACVSVPGENDVGERKASWQGAPVVELIAAFGGQPGLKKGDRWYWQFWASPEKRDNYNRGAKSLSLSGSSACRNCEPSSFTGSPAANPTHNFLRGGGPTPKSDRRFPPLCTYLVDVEDGTIVKLSTLSAPGAFCRFDELPMRVPPNSA